MYKVHTYDLCVMKEGLELQFKDNLKYYRKARGMTQQNLASELKIDRSTYSFYELGKARPKFEVLRAIAKIFGVTVDQLLGDNEDEGELKVSSPKNFETPELDDKFNDLSDFEKTVVFKTRLMSASQKNKLIEYLSDSENVSY